MIVKVQTSLPDGATALVYDRKHSVEGEFPAAELPDDVKHAVKRGGGKAYFRATMIGTKIGFGAEAPMQGW